VAVGVVSGLVLAAIPNVELVTACCFSAGFLLGPLAGIVTGLLTEMVFAGFHPMGSSMGFLLVSQMLGMAGAGFAGGMVRSLVGANRSWYYRGASIAAAVVVTLFFDLITNLAYPVSVGFRGIELGAYLVAGLPFAAIHLISNVAVFAVIVTPLLPRLERVIT
jgi:MFS family permease